MSVREREYVWVDVCVGCCKIYISHPFIAIVSCWITSSGLHQCINSKSIWPCSWMTLTSFPFHELITGRSIATKSILPAQFQLFICSLKTSSCISYILHLFKHHMIYHTLHTGSSRSCNLQQYEPLVVNLTSCLYAVHAVHTGLFIPLFIQIAHHLTPQDFALELTLKAAESSRQVKDCSSFLRVKLFLRTLMSTLVDPSKL